MTPVEKLFKENQKHPTDGAEFYQLGNCLALWGDYGQVFVNGGYGRSEDDPAYWGLQRPGPYVPPIFFARGLIATESAKRKFELSDLRGFSFTEIPVVKAVHIPWHTWNLNAEDPEFYPEDQNPIGYLEDLPHDANLAATFEKFWRLEHHEGGKEHRIKIDDKCWHDKINLISASWTGADFFHADETTRFYISRKAFEWLRANFEPWFHVRSAPVE